MADAEEFERETIDLSGFWSFKIDPEGIGEAERWFEQDRPTGWDKLYVPSSWNEQDSAYTWYMGKAWYSRRFYVPRDWRGRLIDICFEGVNYIARVWVNGAYLGEHEGGFTPFSFRVEDHLAFGGFNKIFLSADNTLTKKTVPPGEGMNRTYFDFFHYGGIHREVYLIAYSRLYVKDVTVRTDLRDCDGIVDVDVQIANETGRDQPCMLTISILDENAPVANLDKNIVLKHSSKEIFSEKL
ncbi:MAG: sugar-binding domain-containing protein, partial [Thermoproteota archaeon]